MTKNQKAGSRRSTAAPESAGVCVYGHFYQPLREDPFTREVPREPGAEPFANYNEKIDAECYRPNATLGNFRRLSFDVGPTLVRWLEANDPHTLRLIVRADRWNVSNYGHGNALAHPFHHTILPLAPRRDKEIQVDWGISDFVRLFGRPPEGMWLPETAVDLETLEVLAERGIRYTVLAPWQATGQAREPLDPCVIHLSSGQRINAFFFESALSRAVSFDPTTTLDAEKFVASRLPKSGQELILIASDGELYGHHQGGRERFLHDLLFVAAEKHNYRVLSLGEYLNGGHRFATGGIREKTSWSCHHGVARWSEGCSCTEGDSNWKPVLRRALDTLALGIDQISAEATGDLLVDYWAATKDYIGVVLGTTSKKRFLDRHSKARLSAGQAKRALDLLQAQYYRQVMYTSCAFFWDDLSRLEVRNAIGYAARAIGLVGGEAGSKIEVAFMRDLSRAVSQRSGENGAEIYAKWREST